MITPVGPPTRKRLAVPAPTSGPLADTFGRVHSDLRISVTDRCNFRCSYCMPAEHMTWLPREGILTYEEIERVARVLRGLGVSAVRLTGGEPLVRADVPVLVSKLAALGFEDLSLTTNGVGLPHLAPALVAAGLKRVNVSCDSLDRDRFATITRRDALPQVLEGMAAAEAAGLAPVKVNVVLMRGVNDQEVVDFAAFARDTGRPVRFIEYMPLDAAHAWERPDVVPGQEILDRISAVWPLEPIGTRDDDPAPADRYRFSDGGGEIGVIASVTDAFCGTCNRLRLTADGALRNCLFATREWSARDLLRAGASDADLEAFCRKVVWAKAAGHGIDDPTFEPPARSMSQIGG
ncbi:MAG: Molybdenum cofactor biosynthesis protein MoaA [Acidimicrobiales bacterium]|nr:Molybdenum cofactor biosynthesis protein MoaA [Acidimicrobiales bacterium]